MSMPFELAVQCGIDMLVKVQLLDKAFSNCDMRLAPTRIECYFLCCKDSECGMFSYNPTLTQCCMVPGCDVNQESSVIQEGTHTYKVENTASCRCTGASFIFSAPSGLCFKVFDDGLSWDQARLDCESREAQLVKLDSQEKHQAIKVYLGGALSVHYIGGNKQTSQWRWLDGSDVAEVYNGWAPLFPNDLLLGGDCLALGEGVLTFHNWINSICGVSLPYVCQIVL